ncbi:protein phosphatase 2C domain-containing protein [Kribbella qitaiheensis]|uniref:Protein phosphatase 2C domain-containing protein n=1 Tax=Kribbella qitaiheensis TaxID=1544730 RepID=A0A7G6X0X2_9ACTN|nr:protein phosphatase 2C domain-containing protein [Kribbella qitaiheensis]QNE19887.1 protein phosphatase 2C domain-containing protein [Kribbella qitaiheensis]
MEIRSACQPAPDRLSSSVNEDLVLTGQDFVVVLDGATAPPQLDSGCRHDVPWLVERLGTHLVLPLLARSTTPLADLLADAIAAVCAEHAGTCDLTNADSPSSTVSMLRVGPDQVEHLVLADSPIVLRSPERQVTVLADNRVDLLPEYTFDAVRRLRNQPGGFWVASTAPKAAYEAVAGTTDRAVVEVAAVLTDGASRYAERYGHSWDELVDVLAADGPQGLIDRVREYDAVAVAGSFRGKRHDDATAVLCRLS